MAEGFAKSHLKEYLVSSGGTHPEKVNPYAIKVMSNIGIDISNHISKKINDDEFNSFDLIITLCGDARDKCPILESSVNHTHWNIKDPAIFEGAEEETLFEYRRIRNLIHEKIISLKTKLMKEFK